MIALLEHRVRAEGEGGRERSPRWATSVSYMAGQPPCTRGRMSARHNSAVCHPSRAGEDDDVHA